MPIGERELSERLSDDDDAVVTAALHEHFSPADGRALGPDWCPIPTLSVEPDLSAGPPEEVGSRLMNLANGAERLLRTRRFRWRLRRQPAWPIVLCEGDSWVAHPFVFDAADHLMDERQYAFNLLSLGAAGDRIDAMEHAAEYRQALDDHDVAAVLLSGGGNDMLAGYEVLLDLAMPVDEPEVVFINALEPHMRRALATIERVLAAVREADADVPIVVHGYDYLRVAPRGQGKFLAPYFDHMRIDDPGRRAHVIRCLVDRFNRDVERAAEGVGGVSYVDLRGLVPDGEWHDEIHPDKVGFARVAEVFAGAINAVIG